LPPYERTEVKFTVIFAYEAVITDLEKLNKYFHWLLLQKNFFCLSKLFPSSSKLFWALSALKKIQTSDDEEKKTFCFEFDPLDPNHHQLISIFEYSIGTL